LAKRRPWAPIHSSIGESSMLGLNPLEAAHLVLDARPEQSSHDCGHRHGDGAPEGDADRRLEHRCAAGFVRRPLRAKLGIRARQAPRRQSPGRPGRRWPRSAEGTANREGSGRGKSCLDGTCRRRFRYPEFVPGMCAEGILGHKLRGNLRSQFMVEPRAT